LKYNKLFAHYIENKGTCKVKKRDAEKGVEKKNKKNAIFALQVSAQLCTFALNLQKPSYKWRRFSNRTPI